MSLSDDQSQNGAAITQEAGLPQNLELSLLLASSLQSNRERQITTEMQAIATENIYNAGLGHRSVSCGNI